MGFFKKIFSREKKQQLDSGLQKTKEGVWSKISRAVAGKSRIDDEVLDRLEEAFISSDVGVETTLKIIERIQERVSRDKYMNAAELRDLLAEEIAAMLAENTKGDTGAADFSVPQVRDTRMSSWLSG